MKRNIIILVALIVLFAMPVLAKPMVAVTNPFINEEFMFNECPEEILSLIIGNVEAVDTSGKVVYNSNTGNMINTEKIKKFKTMSLGEITVSLVQSGVDPYTASTLALLYYETIYTTLSNLFAEGY